MIIYQIPTSKRLVMAEVLQTTKRGELYVQPEAEPRRWIPPDWVVEKDEEE